ncbi:MAG: hypothetical protein FD169_1531 [Bacillota bacterium]|nr:MAG: hypothetical protein FD169_1531 [Bacillota bacterium]MBS3949090.1 hypothetical protein [Peptococcaceae bacterium]
MKATKILVLVLILTTVFFGVQYFRSALANPSGGDYDTIRKEALAFYQANNPDMRNLTAKVINYGCHFEIEILQNGSVVGRVGWAGPGSYYDIR